MTPFWLFLRHTKAGKAISAILAVLALVAALWAVAYTQGRGSIIQQQIENALKAWETRNGIETNVERLDHLDLCIQLGGLRRDCIAELRRLDEATRSEQASTPGN